MSMSKGLCQNATASNKLVTIDIMNKNDKGFKKYRHITRIKGDALDSAITKRVLSCFDNEIDLLFIDSLHEYEHTKKNIAIYAARLNPRYVILDDIRQCDEMRKLWHEIEEEFGENALDLSDVIMRSGAGFGIINWR